MKMYHYTWKPQESILPFPIDVRSGSKLMAQIVMGDARQPPMTASGAWSGSMAFFHERLPVCRIAAHFGDTNPFWPQGYEFYEYEVDVADLGEFYFYVLDPPELAGFIPGAFGTGRSYPEQWLAVMTEFNYLGTSAQALNMALMHLKRRLPVEGYFDDLQRLQDISQISSQYSMGLPVISLRVRPDPITAFKMTCIRC